MEKFYKKKIIQDVSKDISFKIIEWFNVDQDNNDEEESQDSYNLQKSQEYVMRCFGRSEQGDSITCKITGFQPFYYVKVDMSFNKNKLYTMLNYIESHFMMNKYINPIVKNRCDIIHKKDIYGFTNGKVFKFVKLVFSNYTALLKSRFIFKNALHIPGITQKSIKFKLYESNFEPFIRFCHVKDILLAGWVKLPGRKYKVTSGEANTQIEIEIDRRDIESLKEKNDDANFLQMSWDIETYSFDGEFPLPTIKENVIYQISSVYQYINDKKPLVKHLFTLKKISKIDDPNTIIEECKTESELLLKWTRQVKRMDPDVMYTYNGDNFDCRYIMERCILLGLVTRSGEETTFNNFTFKNYKYTGEIVDNLSRLKEYPAEMRKEYFSSSAYGDNDYSRFYLAGRLMYDLLIHYQRNIKSASYKLDFIAESIIGENKDQVSVKQIFEYYKNGNPDELKIIAEYCLKDSELLQRLVDYQMIFKTIIQMANVTHVPTSYLLTKGQTIKVYSQTLRKARQMNFLVPHTNYNEDSFPIAMTFKEIPDGLVIGDYASMNINKKTINAKIIDLDEERNIVYASTSSELSDVYYNVRVNKKYVANKVYNIEESSDDTFTGATVLTAKAGYYENNVCTLDFASLYPTIEIANNLDYSTLVIDDKYLNIPGVDYQVIEWDDKIEYKLKQKCTVKLKSGKNTGNICGKQAFFTNTKNTEFYCRMHDPLKKTRPEDEKFQKKNVHYKFVVVQSQKGVIPSMLEELYNERKSVKKLMYKAEQEGNKVLAEILNSTQLAIKTSLNSVYGYVSRNKGNLICKPLGIMTTFIGRSLIEKSKTYIEGAFMEFLNNTPEYTTHQLRIDESVSKMSRAERDLILKNSR